MIFERGQTIVRRHLYPDGRVGSVLCGRVVSDDERGLALWIEAGSQAMRRVDTAGQPTRSLSLLTSLRMTTLLSLTTWQPFRTLMWMPRGAAHSVWWSWRPGDDFAGWYVNLERPVIRWAGGVDVYDQELDLLVYPDGRWSWKDEDAFAEYTATRRSGMKPRPRRSAPRANDCLPWPAPAPPLSTASGRTSGPIQHGGLR